MTNEKPPRQLAPGEILFSQYIGHQRVDWVLHANGEWEKVGETAPDLVPVTPVLTADQLRSIYEVQDEMARKSERATPLPPSPMDRSTLPTAK